MTILWLHGRTYSSGHRFLVEAYMKAADIDTTQVLYMSLHNKIKNLWTRKEKTKNKWICNPLKKTECLNELDNYIKMFKPSLLVINDAATLGFITNQETPSMHNSRSSVYSYKGIPAIVINTLGKKNQPLVKMVRHGPWYLLNDLKKVQRWYNNSIRIEPKFNYKVAHTIADLDEVAEEINKTFCIATDIETVGQIMDCIGFTYIDSGGRLKSFVVPFYNPTKPGNCHWDTEDEEIHAWEFVRTVLANSAYKTMQGGGYDSAYFIRHNLPANNYLFDTTHLFHSIWSEAPKKLHEIASIALDRCRFWKDENKGLKDERIPTTKLGLERRWRYNALDCHYTLLSTIWLVEQITKPTVSWALNNYNTEFRLEVGPALSMSMTGMLTDKYRKTIKNIEWMEAYQKNLKELRIMTDDTDFNPNSDKQVAHFIYDVLGAAKFKTTGRKKLGDRSVDERVLKFIRIQHPLFAMYIDKIWATKKPANNSAKYGQMRLMNGRFLYRYGAAGTKFGRFNGKEHQFWIGTSPQNIPKKSRDMYIADNGYVYVEIDYSQSDLYFVAFECEDQLLMETVLDDRDTHSVHAEFFFKKPYQIIYDAHLRKEDWVENPITGVRQNTKRIVHGADYQMAGFTLYMLLGHEATVATAKALGYTDAHLWTRKLLVELCSELLLKYHMRYPGLPKWFDSSVTECAKNGNLATCAFGNTHLFFGDITADANIQRELSSFYGQGGTSGNINRALNTIYYETDLAQQGLMLLLQTHDSIGFQIPEKKLHLIKNFLTIMEGSCTIKGRTFTVPAEVSIGYSWEKGMIPWYKGIEIDEIKKAETIFAEKTYGQTRWDNYHGISLAELQTMQ